MTNSKTFYKAFVSFFLLLFLFSGYLTAADFVAMESGDWNDPDTWGGISYPNTEYDNVIINNYIISVNGANALANNITIGQNGTLNFSTANSLTVYGNLTNAGILNVLNSSGLSLQGTFINTGTLSNFSNHNLTVNGSAAINLTLPKEITTLNTLTINKTNPSSKVILDSSLSVTSNLTVTNGEISTGRNDLSIGGNLTFNGNGKYSTDSNAIVTLTGNLIYNSSSNSTPDIHSSIVFDGTSSITTAGTGKLILNDITVNATKSLTSSGAFTVSGDVVNNGNWNTESGTITFDNSATWLYAKTISSTSSMTFSTLIIANDAAVSNSANILLEDSDNFSFSVEGNGSFICTSGTVTVGETNYDGDLYVANNALSTLEFNDLIISNLNMSLTTISDFIIKGDLNVGANANFTATTPSTITFKNTESNSTAKYIKGTGTASKKKFYNLLIAPSSSVATTASFNISRDFTVSDNGDFRASGSSTLTFIEGGNKELLNSGVLIFKNLTIAQAITGDNVLSTSSNFTVSGEFLAQGTNGDPLNGSFTAYNNSEVKLSGSSVVTPYNSQTTAGTSLKFMNLRITGSDISSNKSFIIKGNFINSGSFEGTSGTITLAGTDQQIISGTACTFSTLTINNPSGVKLETDMFFSNQLILINGDLDLGGSNTITMVNTSSRLFENPDATIVNTSPGEGSVTGGYISSRQIALKTDVDETGLGIAIANGNSSNITVRRFQNYRTIDTVGSISRYYRLDYSGANIGDITLTFDNSELNGANGNALYLYYANSDNTTNWTRTSSTVTFNEGNLTGTIIETGLAGLGTPLYLTLAPFQVSIENLPYTGINTLNRIVESPLVAGQQDQIVFGFNINTPTAIEQMDSLKIAIHSSTYTNQFENYELKYDTDQDLTTFGLTSTSATVTELNDTLDIKGINPSTLSSGDNYFVLVADVSSTVTTSNNTVSFTMSNEDVFLNVAETNDIEISSPSYSFTQVFVTADVSNTPSAYLTSSASLTNQTIFGFTLTPTENSPSSTFSSIILTITSSSYSHFNNLKLWNDVNKNGFYDAADGSQLGSSATLTVASQTYTFSGFTQTFTEDQEFIITCIVSPSAQTYSNIKAMIIDDSLMTMSDNVTVTPFSSTLSGNTMTVAATTTATKLSIKNISLVTPIDGFTSNQFETGANLTITVESQNSLGRPHGVLSATDVTFTITAGSAVITNNSATISQYNSLVTINNFILTNALGGSGIYVTASATSFTSSTYSSITLFAQEPSVSPSGLIITNVTQTSASISWDSGTPTGNILIAKQGGIPDPPVKGTSYTQATGNNFSTPNGSTGSGSYVVYSGTGNSINISGLATATEYYFTVYNYNGSGNGIRYLLEREDGDLIVTADTTTLSTEPTVQTSSLVIINPQDTSLKLTWTNGNGSKRLVLARLNSAVSTSPTDGELYDADNSYGEGSQIGDAFVVFSGSSSSVTITNLSASSSAGDYQYYFAVYEYNDAGGFVNYLTAGAPTASRKTLYQEPIYQASNISFAGGPASSGYFSDDNTILVSWTNGGGEGRIVTCSATLTTNEVPQDASVSYNNTPSTPGASVPYGTTGTLGNAFVIYKGTGETNAVQVTGLTYGYRYYFRVYEYNGTGVLASTSQINYLTSESDDNPNNKIADKYEPNDTYSVLQTWQYVVPDGTEYSGVLTDTTDEDWYYFEPNTADGINNLRVVLKNLPANYEIELYNYTGTRLLRKSYRTNASDEIIVINNVPRGRYYIRIFSQYNNEVVTPYKFRVDGESGRILSGPSY